MFQRILLTLYSFLFLLAYVQAQSRTNIAVSPADPRGRPELVICSQNLDNYGLLYQTKRRKKGFSDYDYEEKQTALLNRFAKAKCDVIAAQEVTAKDKFEALTAMKEFADMLQKRTNRFFEVAVSESNDSKLRLAFLVAKDRAEILNRISFNKIELPKIATLQKQRMFSRGPFEVQLRVKGKDAAPAKQVSIFNFHFKSKSTKGGTDAAGLEFEPFRIEMAETLRRLVESRHKASFSTGRRILVLAGDRNSHFDVASAKVLEGVLNLSNFQEGGACRLSQRGMPLCKLNVVAPQRLFSVLTTDPQTKSFKGTYRYKSIYSWIDDIIMPAESLNFALATPGVEGDYNSGVVSEYSEASDHSMVWVVLNW